MSKVRQAILYSFASRYALRLIGLASTMIIARLLTPAEIGTYAIAGAIVVVMSEFRILGAASYLIREKDIPPEKVQSALGLTCIISWGLGAAIFLSAPLVAEFYQKPEISNVFRILSLSFFVAPYISIPTALLQRRYEFGILFRVALFANIAGVVSTIGLIMAGFSFYSLALGHALMVLVEFILILSFWPKGTPWVPRFSGMKPIVEFGVFASVVNFIRRSQISIPDMIIGKLGTTVQVAMFSRGLGLVDFLAQLLISGANPIVLPFLSDTKRNGGNLMQAYIRAGVLLGGLVCPVLLVAGFASLPAIRLFFGDQWDAAAPIATWLAIWGALRCMHWFSADVLMANGRERVMLMKELLTFSVLVVAVITCFPAGLVAIAQGFVIAGLFDVVVTTLVLKYAIGLSVVAYIREWGLNLIVSFVCVLTAYGISNIISFDNSNYWQPVGLLALVMPIVWLLSIFAVRHPLHVEIVKLKNDVLTKLRS